MSDLVTVPTGDQLVRVLKLDDLQKQRKSDALNETYYGDKEKEPGDGGEGAAKPAAGVPEEATVLAVEAPSVAEKQKKTSGKRKKKNGAGSVRERDVLTSLVSFLPRNRRREAKEFVKAVGSHPKMLIVHNNVIVDGKKKSHILALLARRFLALHDKNDKLFNSLFPAKTDLKGAHTAELSF